MTPRPTIPGKTHEPGWSFHNSTGSALDFHDRPIPELIGQAGQVWIHRSTQPAIVLGSAQQTDLIDIAAAEAAGWEVGRRRSGGGVVVLLPTTHVWVDFLIGPSHSLWNDDAHRAFDWVGQLWADSIQRLTAVAPHVHQGPLLDRADGRLLCFAGLGAGEIAIDGYKLVGLSQRRTRLGARFQTMLELADNSDWLLPFARGPMRNLLDQRATTRPERGIGIPPGHDELVPLLDRERTLATLLDSLEAQAARTGNDPTPH